MCCSFLIATFLTEHSNLLKKVMIHYFVNKPFRFRSVNYTTESFFIFKTFLSDSTVYFMLQIMFCGIIDTVESGSKCNWMHKIWFCGVIDTADSDGKVFFTYSLVQLTQQNLILPCQLHRKTWFCSVIDGMESDYAVQLIQQK